MRLTEGCAHGRSPPGFRPGKRLTFLLVQESKQRTRPRFRRPACGRVPCAARNAGPAQNSLRSLRSLRSDSWAELDGRACVPHAARRFCAARHLHRGSSQQPNTEQPGLQRLRRFPATGCLDFGCSAAGCSAVGCSPFVAAEQHSVLGRARSAHQLLDQGGRPNGVSTANAVRSALQPQDASSAGNPRPQAGDSGAGACSLPTFLHEQESRSAAGTKSRRALRRGSSSCRSNRKKGAQCMPRLQHHTAGR